MIEFVHVRYRGKEWVKTLPNARATQDYIDYWQSRGAKCTSATPRVQF